MQIAIVLYDGFDDLDAVGPNEVFKYAKMLGVDLNAGLYTLGSTEIVESAHGLRVIPDGILPVAPSIVIVPGGNWNEEVEDTLTERLVNFDDGATTIASVCTGGILLARAGITDDRPAITHHKAVSELRDSGADVVEARVVDDGDLLTAGGVTSGIDLALHIIEREFSEEIANEVSNYLEYNRTGDVSVREVR